MYSNRVGNSYAILHYQLVTLQGYVPTEVYKLDKTYKNHPLTLTSKCYDLVRLRQRRVELNFNQLIKPLWSKLQTKESRFLEG